ncbi:MAG: hypothetical protein AB7U20_05495 [Planctomycetaceae bacterium]
MSNTTTIPQLLLKPAEAVKAPAISERAHWTLAEEGQFRVVKISRQRQYILSQLQEDVERRQSGSAEDQAVG